MRGPLMLLSATLLVRAAACGASYYVSPAGDDAGPGTLAQPFASIQHGVSRLNPGDTLFVRGGNYHEAVRVDRSGAAEAPITIQAYPGECPMLVGAAPVSGPWTVHSGAIYKAPWPTQPRQVFAAGRLLNEARWPNTALEDFAGMTYAVAEAGGTTSIADSALPDIDLTGAWIHIMAGQSWVAYSRPIAVQDRASRTLSFAAIDAMPELTPRRGNHYYVFGKLELLDAPGEWWWDPVHRELYVWMPEGGSPEGRIEAGAASAVLDLSGQSYIVVAGLGARGGWFNLQNSSHCTVTDFYLFAPTWIRAFDGYAVWPDPQNLGGVDVSGSANLVERGSVRLAGRSSINIAGTGNTVRQVTVEDSGWNWAPDSAISDLQSEQAVVEHCTVRRTAMAGIGLAPRSRISHNVVEDSCLFVEDCGNTGSWSMDGRGTEVAYNHLRGNHTRWGAAIYLDAGSKNFYLHDNLAEKIEWNGVNSTGVNVIENNTFVDVRHQGIAFIPPANAVGADWSAGRAAHNQLGQPFPFTVALMQPQAIITDYASFFAYTTLAPQPGPRRVEIDWSQMAQGAWSALQVPMNLSEVDAIAFAIDSPATPFRYTISNLRLLPAGETGDTGAVPVSGGAWTASCGGGSTCTLIDAGSGAWGLEGSTPAFVGTNSLSAPLPPALRDLRPYRGLAFELVGTASRDYAFQGYDDIDNGPDAAPGRGAHLPAHIGADHRYAVSACRVE